MKILYLTQVLPYPLDAGPKIRNYYTLRYMAEKHSVTLLSFIRPTDSEASLNHVRSFCDRFETVTIRRSRFLDISAAFKSLIFNKPFLITRDEVEEMDIVLKNLVSTGNFDIIQSDQLWMAPYALKARSWALIIGQKPKIILDQHNAVFLVLKRMAEACKDLPVKLALQREAKLMAGYEQEICDQFDRVVWVTEEDFFAVCSTGENFVSERKVQSAQTKALISKSKVIPICVDVTENVGAHPMVETSDILFIGGMHWPPNSDGVSWFIRDILPLVLAQHPLAKFNMVGKNPPPFPPEFNQSVFPLGYVENADLYWNSARVFVVPLRSGGGMRVKILDAWAMGIPIVSTSIGAEGIKYTPGTDILIADSPGDFANAILQILIDNDLALNLSINGKKTLANQYDWKKVYPAWDEVYSNNSSSWDEHQA